MFTNKLWVAIHNVRDDVSFLKDSREKYRQRIELLVRDFDRLNRRAESRFIILEDAVSRVARTLDANHITEACSHCGQIKPEDWKSKV